MKHASSKPDQAITDAMVGLTFIESILSADIEKYQMVTQNLNDKEIANSLLNACTTVLHYASSSMDMEICFSWEHLNILIAKWVKARKEFFPSLHPFCY
jgi:hypothetical protein